MNILQSTSLLRKSCKRMYCMFAPLDLVTGLEKKELLAYLGGNCDPFYILAIKKGPGTYERPNLVPSAFCSRIIACQCSPAMGHLEYMWLHMDRPARCGCGYWFQLCPVPPIVDT